MILASPSPLSLNSATGCTWPREKQIEETRIQQLPNIHWPQIPCRYFFCKAGHLVDYFCLGDAWFLDETTQCKQISSKKIYYFQAWKMGFRQQSVHLLDLKLQLWPTAEIRICLQITIILVKMNQKRPNGNILSNSYILTK